MIDGLICSYSWPCDEALRVVYGPTPTCPTGESNGNWSAVNNGNYGGFQINAVHAWRVSGVVSALLVPAINIRVAHDIWLDSGGNWRAWSCQP